MLSKSVLLPFLFELGCVVLVVVVAFTSTERLRHFLWLVEDCVVR